MLAADTSSEGNAVTAEFRLLKGPWYVKVRDETETALPVFPRALDLATQAENGLTESDVVLRQGSPY